MNHIFTAFLMFLVLLEGFVIWALFSKGMVDWKSWHEYLRVELSVARKEVTELKQWFADHVHLHTSSPAATPAPSADKK